MDKFIYVFDTVARDLLLQAGFLLLKDDAKNSIYVFSADETRRFEMQRLNISFLTSNTLSF